MKPLNIQITGCSNRQADTSSLTDTECKYGNETVILMK